MAGAPKTCLNILLLLFFLILMVEVYTTKGLNMQKIKLAIGLILYTLSTLACAEQIQGTLEISIADDFTHKQSKIYFSLITAQNTYQLDFAKSINTQALQSGDEIIVNGTLSKALHQNRLFVNKLQHIKTNQLQKSRIDGLRKPIVIVTNFTNLKSTDDISVETLENLLYDDYRSVNQNILRNSFYQVYFDKDVDSDNKADIFVVNLNMQATQCNTSAWGIAAINQLKAKGVDFSKYQHKIFIIPQKSGCWWAGRASLGCNGSCVAYIQSYGDGEWTRHLYAHELGHNLGHRHSASDVNNDGSRIEEYGDSACIMGQSGHLKEMNAAQRDLAGYFDAFPSNIETVSSGYHRLYALEGFLPRNAKVALRVLRQDNEYYYLSYRTNQGRFGNGESQYHNKVSIHHANKKGGVTYFIKAIGKDEIFEDTKRRLRIRVTHTYNGYAQVYIDRY